MGSEYIRLSYPEKIYGQKALLQSQLETLTVAKRLRSYTQIRREELVLQIALKKKVEEVVELAKLLEKLLPKTELGLKNEEEKFLIQTIKQEKKDVSLEEQLDEIRKKIAILQG